MYPARIENPQGSTKLQDSNFGLTLVRSNGPRAKEGPRNTRQHDFSAIHNESKALTPSPSVRFQEPGRQLDAEC